MRAVWYDKVMMMCKGMVSGESSSYLELQTVPLMHEAKFGVLKRLRLLLMDWLRSPRFFSVNGLNRIDSRVDRLYRI